MNTRQLGQWVADAARQNPSAASQAHAAIETRLVFFDLEWAALDDARLALVEQLRERAGAGERRSRSMVHDTTVKKIDSGAMP